MIGGTFGSRGELFFEIELIASNGLNVPVDAMLDTGFTGFLAINKLDLDVLNWQFLREQELQTAQGEAFFDIYLGKVVIDKQEYEIPVLTGDEITEILLGSEWLKLLPLVVNYQTGILTLGSK
ncbi:MAG: aspartyl protease [Cyanosarcina radialis HA8281-LM2]|jgi:clan AA aspartic protease|nr:aspartyl protease [Cyanosarcina radialis HA8281-LM2]